MGEHMNWEIVGSTGEWAGAIAVVVTLFYLARQIRQNTHATRATSHHAITDALNELNYTLATNDSAAHIWQSGMKDRGALDDLQRDQYDALVRAYLHVCDTMYYQAQVGAGDHGLWQAEQRYLAIVLTTQGGSEWWQENHQSVSSDFRGAVQAIIQHHSCGSDETDALAERWSRSE
jgi:hypothetical protein